MIPPGRIVWEAALTLSLPVRHCVLCVATSKALASQQSLKNKPDLEL